MRMMDPIEDRDLGPAGAIPPKLEISQTNKHTKIQERSIMTTKAVFLY